ERELQFVSLQRKLAQAQLDRLLGQVQVVDGVQVVAAQVDLPDVARLREVGDFLKERLGSAVIVLAAVIEGQARLVAMVTPDLVARGYHAGHLVRRAAEIVGGTGGGRPEMAQGGGRFPERLEEALSQVSQLVRAGRHP
ncbi:MAG: DHHA1 domain-containing protein, partial [Chloroflexia bacterium]